MEHHRSGFGNGLCAGVRDLPHIGRGEERGPRQSGLQAAQTLAQPDERSGDRQIGKRRCSDRHLPGYSKSHRPQHQRGHQPAHALGAIPEAYVRCRTDCASCGADNRECPALSCLSCPPCYS